MYKAGLMKRLIPAQYYSLESDQICLSWDNPKQILPKSWLNWKPNFKYYSLWYTLYWKNNQELDIKKMKKKTSIFMGGFVFHLFISIFLEICQWIQTRISSLVSEML